MTTGITGSSSAGTFAHGRFHRGIRGPLYMESSTPEGVRNTGRTMSQEKVEIARQVMEAYNRRDREAWFALQDPELEFRADPGWPESETLRGPVAAWDFIVSMSDAWESDDFEMLEAIDPGGDQLVAHARRPVRGKASGIADVLDRWAVFTVRRGRILSVRWFASRAEALEAAGLSE